MKTVVVAPVLMVILAAAALFAAGPESAMSCSCPDCDTVRDSDVIVGGRVLGWSRSNRPGPDSMTIPMDIQVAVDQVWKGTAADLTVLFDPVSLVNLKDPARTDVPDKFVWMGGAGGCQAFTQDPTGKYIVVGFAAVGENAARVFGPAMFFLGDEPEGERYEAAMTRLGAVGVPYPPDAGNSSTAEAAGSDDWMFVSAIGAGMLLFTLVVVLGGPRRR